jgi:hypothetical protein
MNKVSNFCKSFRMRHHKIKGVTHQINHTVRIFIIIGSPCVALRNPAILSSLRVKRCGIWTGSLSIKSNVLYWVLFV